MGFADIWDQMFKSFMVFVGVGIIWLRFIEPLFADRRLSVNLMIITAVVLSLTKLATGLWQINRKIKAAQAMIEAATAPQEEEA